MRENGLGDVFRILTYVIVSFILAAVISPLLYKAGKNFAEVFLNKDTTDGLVWLAKKAAKAEFDTYFKRSLLIAALLGLWPLVHSIRANRPLGQESMWKGLFGKPALGKSNSWLSGPRQCGFGFFISSILFVVMTLIVQIFGWRIWDPEVSAKDFPSLILESFQTAIFVSLVEEILFRGLLMAIFIRAFRPSLAIIFLSLLFSAVHFLQPPDHASVSDPFALTAGFEMLSLIGQRFMETELLIASFSTLFVIGLILAFARYRTRALWLPIGIHIGWVFSLKFYVKITDSHPDHPDGAGLYLGENMLEGVLPLGALILTGILLAISLRKSPPEQTPSS